MSETYCGSFEYAAPEILKGVPYDPRATDMWAFGVIIYTILNKSMPVSSKNRNFKNMFIFFLVI